MKYLLTVLAIIVSVTTRCLAQKKEIDFDAIEKWNTLFGYTINATGTYVQYTILGNEGIHRQECIRGINNQWQRSYDNADAVSFSSDGKTAIVQTSNRLMIVTLGSEKRPLTIDHITSIKFSKSENPECIAYQFNDDPQLTVRNLVSGSLHTYDNVGSFWFSSDEKDLLFTSVQKKAGQTITKLELCSLEKSFERTILSDTPQAENVSSIVDPVFKDNQISFTLSRRVGDREEASIWYYQNGNKAAVLKADAQAPGIDPKMVISGSPEFSGNGRYLFFKVRDKTIAKPQKLTGLSDVTIWSYKDLVLQPEQQRQLMANSEQTDHDHYMVMPVAGNKAIQIENDDQELTTDPKDVTGDYVVVKRHPSTDLDWWTLSPQPFYQVTSLNNGSQDSLAGKEISHFSFSPLGNFVVYFDHQKGQFVAYNVIQKKRIVITNGIAEPVTKDYVNSTPNQPVDDVAGWEVNEKSLILYDNYDIWRVDPSGKSEPINITNGFGKANHVKFRLVDPKPSFRDNDVVLLTAFNQETKYNGFFHLRIGHSSKPLLLTMGPYSYYKPFSQIGHGYSFANETKPVKAQNANLWAVKRESFDQPANVFITADFKKFQQISTIERPKTYNWLTAELISWKQLDGTITQGVVYKPENFDPAKKYPVIFNYYEELSHRLYEFPTPAITEGDLNIPWFVSRGYLVVTPDLHFSVAKFSGMTPGDAAYNAVVSGAKFVAQLPFVDSTRIGLQGHSFGGLETNFLITHSHAFAAAAEFAGVTDPVSSYLTLVPLLNHIESSSYQTIIENGHWRLGDDVTPWNRPELFVGKSPVLNADKITTPLLITHNPADNNIPWRQGVELYMAMRRLQKKVWMLEYDGSAHLNYYGKDGEDYTIRLTQFFDYYLKGLPPPKWMTKGIPAELKGTETGYELDHSGATP